MLRIYDAVKDNRKVIRKGYSYCGLEYAMYANFKLKIEIL